MRPFRLAYASFVICLVCILGCGEPQKYSAGKDTVESFGDGTWSIVKTGGGDVPRKLHLSRRDLSETVVVDIVDWRQEGDWIYLFGSEGEYTLTDPQTGIVSKHKKFEYTVVNFRTGVVSRYDKPENAPEEQRQTLRKLNHRY